MDFEKLILARRSVRKYVPAEISAEEISAIVAEAEEAPSWQNKAPTRYRAVLDRALFERVRAEGLLGSNCAKAENASAIVLVTYVKGRSGFLFNKETRTASAANELGDGWGIYDAGLASAYFLLAAKNRGWDSLVIGIRDAAKLRELFEVPEGEDVLAAILLGKSGEEALHVPRKPVEEILIVK